MLTFLIHNWKKGVIVKTSRADTDERIEAARSDFKNKQLDKDGDIRVQQIYPDQVTPQGIPYDWDATYEGGIFGLYVYQGQSWEDIMESRRYLRNSFDVVKAYTHRIKLVDLNYGSPASL